MKFIELHKTFACVVCVLIWQLFYLTGKSSGVEGLVFTLVAGLVGAYVLTFLWHLITLAYNRIPEE